MKPRIVPCPEPQGGFYVEHDGERFWARDYALAVTLRNTLSPPRSEAAPYDSEGCYFDRSTP